MDCPAIGFDMDLVNIYQWLGFDQLHFEGKGSFYPLPGRIEVQRIFRCPFPEFVARHVDEKPGMKYALSTKNDIE